MLAQGLVRFRLWAPKAQTVSVDFLSRSLLMVGLNDGWFELRTSGAGPGTRYQFNVDQGSRVPDSASRYQPLGVHGPSEVIDPRTFEWNDTGWRGCPWEETFSPEGTFAGAKRKLDYLAGLRITTPKKAKTTKPGTVQKVIKPRTRRSQKRRRSQSKALTTCTVRFALRTL